ncbi:cytochrome P450 CYP72A219-like [Camellia sinensis]|uniref:cytochrome P450 CYP72A219-like n=1 Tax=Camellia sinensis TaxID=4442 RepID=UPI0010359149|nr:cytochrome P450 CYP72A219-like [Camellia sinensis]
MVPTIFVHHDREIWEEYAEEFKLERFLEGIAKATKKQLSFFPFGEGSRICIGNSFAMTEAKMAIALILINFSFEFSPSYTHAPSFIFTLRPQYGVHLVLHKI